MAVRIIGASPRHSLPICLLLGISWLGAFALILVSFLCCGLMLPLIPLFIAVVFGVSALLRTVHDFADARRDARSRQRRSGGASLERDGNAQSGLPLTVSS